PPPLSPRSLHDALPISSLARQPAILASWPATHWVLALRLRTRSSQWGPDPAGAKPRSSSTTKSSGAPRSSALAGGAPSARGGESAAPRVLGSRVCTGSPAAFE